MQLKPQNLMRGLFRTVSVVALFAVLTVVISGGLFFFSLIKDLPDVTKLKEFRHSHATQVFDADGRRIGEFTTERRYPVQFEAIPKHVIRAFLAAEDSKFYEHKGIDYAGIARAVLSNVVRGHYAQGGSTITQQVARALLLNSKKKEITRKIREMVLAWRMEKELTKNEILNLYLSEIYLGHGAFGIGAAAQNYFGKKVEELDIAEGAMLAGLPQRPNDWNPFHNPMQAKKRQAYVLERMVKERFIEPKDQAAALAEPLKLHIVEDINNTAAPYFTEFVRQWLMSKYGSDKVLTAGLSVYTTVKYDYQKQAERVLLKGLREVDKRLGWRGVKTHVENDKTAEFLAQTHEEIVGKLTPIRVLPSSFDGPAKKLTYDLTPFHEQRDRFFGATPVEEGSYYTALVTQVDEGANRALVQIGQTGALLPFSGLEWVKIKDKPVKRVAEVVKPGDVIQVKVDKIDRKLGVVQTALEQDPEIQGALLSYDIATGDVQAMVGGTNFEKSKFNIALQAKRQVGSTTKPVLYAAAIDKGFSPASIVTDSPIVFKHEELDADNQGEDWRPHNYGGTFEGDIPLRLALIRSMNIPTVKLLNEITVDYGISYMRKLGITAVLPRDLSIGLGSWSSSLEEVTRAFAVFPRLGKPLQLNYIKKVVDGEGKVLVDFSNGTGEVAKLPDPTPTGKGEAVAAAPSPTPEPGLQNGEVISPQTAYVMTDMLKGVVREGTGRPAFLGTVPVAGKTGTSNDHRDAWFIGYTPFVMTGVWLGYEKDKPLTPAETGGKSAAPIWAEYMTRIVKDYPKNDFPIPDDVVFANIDKHTGKLVNASAPNHVRVAFRAGGVPNSNNDNLPRVGEPGTTRAAAASSTVTDPNPATHFPDESKKDPETDDYLRQGYQD